MRQLATKPLHRTSPVFALAFILLCAMPGVARADGPAGFVKQAGTQLVSAARSGSHAMMAAVIHEYSDLPDIGLYSLGNYRGHLPSSRRNSYYEGVARFMARYFIDQARQFQIASFKVYTESSKTNWGYEVDSIVTLKSGELHKLRWHVVPRSGGYKVRDVSIVGIWLTPISMIAQQKDLFESYIRDNGGKLTALLSALGS